MNPYLKEQDITFVIQGAIITTDSTIITQKTIQSIRNYFPSSKIIVSTWDECLDHANLVLDSNTSIITSRDPGPVNTTNRYFLNYKRMVLSTYEGIRKSKTRYVAKVRSDFWFEHDSCLKIIDIYNKSISTKSYLTSSGLPIMMCTSSNHYPLFPFYISDWFHLGFKDDLEELWRPEALIEKSSYPQYSNFFIKTLCLPFNKSDVGNLFEYPFHSEQQLFIDYLKRLPFIDSSKLPESHLQVDAIDLVRSCLLIDQLFVRISRDSLGLRSSKHYVSRDLFGRFMALTSRFPISFARLIVYIMLLSSLYLLRISKILVKACLHHLKL